ncbi:MAG: hypothetical protein IT168_08155 [Bryobacterales bacterium]|nr:hypothetical protein [Bryobacterales bacterium]
MSLKQTLFLCLLLIGIAVPGLAFSTGPVPGRTGAAADGGLTCTACHRGNNLNDGVGKLTILVRDYKPGVKQKIRVMLQHPTAARWGFQLTARLASDPTQPAGTFLPANNYLVKCFDNTFAPCNGLREFVEHTQPTTFAGQRGSASWDIEWMPPSSDVGPVVFYAAGNAANNNGTNTGDFIYTTDSTIQPQNCNLTATPRITKTRHGASLADGPFASNSMLIVDGTGFQAPAKDFIVDTLDFVDDKYPSTASCVAVEINGRRAPITYVGPEQINVQIPTTTEQGSFPVRVIANPGQTNERRSDPVNIQLADAAPAFFRLLPSDAAAAVMLDGSIAANPAQFSFAKAPKPGDTLILFATGLGFTDPVYQAGEIPTDVARLRQNAVVEWNGTALAAADVTYVGLAPYSISALYQINLKVPANARTNADNQVRLRVGSRTSPDVTLYVGR